MSIASDLIRGNTDMIILAQLMQKESYGYEINKKIQERTPTCLTLPRWKISGKSVPRS